jgi:hypothetical protein
MKPDGYRIGGRHCGVNKPPRGALDTRVPMTTYNKKKFSDLLFDSGEELRDAEFIKCHFAYCRCLLAEAATLHRCTIQGVRLLNCSQDRCLLEGPILQDVVVDGLDTKGQLPEILGAAFCHVVLRGKIDRLWIKPRTIEPSMQKLLDKANATFFTTVDWALDISQADCKQLEIKGVPIELIRRDPETQGIVTYKKAAEGRWKKLKFQHGLFEVVFEDLTESKHPGALLIAAKRSPAFKKLVADLEMLRNEGIAEPE